MLISKKELGKLVALENVSTDQLALLYNNYGGLEVEEITTIVPQNKYIIGYIETIIKHPDADKLNICTVNIGSETLQIVCGAPNAAADKYVIVAPVGTIMPDGMEIARREVRGVESVGMICSLQEIGLDSKYVDERYKDGIYLFEDEKFEVGSDALKTLGFDTEVIELSITPDRADCMNYRGVAHETSALLKTPIADSIFEVEQPKGSFSIKEYVEKLDVISKNVIDYNLIAFRNVVTKPSPLWMQSFLIASGVRPISNVVDITNYVMLYLGIPLHAFDGSKLAEKQIIVREARENEQIITLDAKTRNLDLNDILITTGEEAIALAGVMGGENTEIDSNTTTVILEAAIFAPIQTRKTATKFNLRSDASQRYEKGVDSNLPKLALKLVSKLMVELAEAEVSTDILSMNVSTKSNREIAISHTELVERVGIEFTETDVLDAFNRLKFEVTTNADNYIVKAPSWRLDIQILEDLVEEVARLYGFENLPNVVPIDTSRPVFKTATRIALDRVHYKLQAQGIQEILPYTLTSPEKAVLGVDKEVLEPIKILYPLNNERSTIRTTTYSSMIDILQYHVNRMFDGVAFYEITSLYGKATERRVLSLGAYGELIPQKLYQAAVEVDFYVMKQWIESIFEYLPIHELVYKPSENNIFHPGVSADIYYHETYLGSFGKIHPLQANKLDVTNNQYLAQISIDTIMNIEKELAKKSVKYQIISNQPTIERDLAFVIERKLPVATLIETIREKAGASCTNITLFDVYTGEHIQNDKKSIALRLTFNHKTETLKSETIDEIIAEIIETAKNICKAELRQ